MFFEAADHAGIVGVACAGACIDHDVDSGQFMLVKPERLPDQALYAVAPDRAADDAGGNRQTKTGSGSAAGADKDRKQRIGKTSRILVDAVEIRFVMKTLRRGERPGECLQESGR